MPFKPHRINAAIKTRVLTITAAIVLHEYEAEIRGISEKLVKTIFGDRETSCITQPYIVTAIKSRSMR